MSTIKGMFEDRDVEARFAPDGFERVAAGHYRRRTPLEQVMEDVHEAIRDDLRKMEDLPLPLKAPTPLEAIATQIRTMPYGDVVAMAEGTGTDPGKLWNWATK